MTIDDEAKRLKDRIWKMRKEVSDNIAPHRIDSHALSGANRGKLPDEARERKLALVDDAIPERRSHSWDDSARHMRALAARLEKEAEPPADLQGLTREVQNKKLGEWRARIAKLVDGIQKESRTPEAPIADLRSWAGGLPAAGPPAPQAGQPDDAWEKELRDWAKRVQEAAKAIPRVERQSLESWALEIEAWASNLQRMTQVALLEPQGPTPGDLYRITGRVGRLLGATERLMLAYEQEVERADPPLTEKPLTVLSCAMTVIATARDHVLAADGTIKNLRKKDGLVQGAGLTWLLLVAVILYAAGHPQWGLVAAFRVPTDAQPFWEIIFWAVFGSIVNAYLRGYEDLVSDRFDPRHPVKYVYRIPIAPIVAIIIIFFWALIGVSLGGGTAEGEPLVDSLSKNILTLIVVSFILGFFSERAVAVLDRIWTRLGTEKEAEERKSTTIGGTTSSPVEQMTVTTVEQPK